MDIMVLKSMALLGCFVISTISVVGVTEFLSAPSGSEEAAAQDK